MCYGSLIWSLTTPAFTGVLAVTRALGDASVKEFVVGNPYTTETRLDEGDEFLIVACDGVSAPTLLIASRTATLLIAILRFLALGRDGRPAGGRSDQRGRGSSRSVQGSVGARFGELHDRQPQWFGPHFFFFFLVFIHLGGPTELTYLFSAEQCW